MKNLDDKIQELLEISGDVFLTVEFYSHTNQYMYKIQNIYTSYNIDKLVLSSVKEGIEHAVNLAIEQISVEKAKFFGEGDTETDKCSCKVGQPYNNLCCPVHGNMDKELN